MGTPLAGGSGGGNKGLTIALVGCGCVTLIALAVLLIIYYFLR